MYYLNSMLNDLFDSNVFGYQTNSSFMKTNIEETETGYVLSMNVAGVKKENIKLSFDTDYLTVGIKYEEETENKKYIIKERQSGEFERTFEFEDVDPESINASLNDGILTINLSKIEQKETKKMIEVK